ncbi:hypothetical protein H0H92_014071 [Tricholoma furcatifolium]|nr:hypothetical protein H0H92_014071 [Tricholoma furcatifolium]
MAMNSTNQLRSIAQVTKAVAGGDLTKKIEVDVRGEILELKETLTLQVRTIAVATTAIPRGELTQKITGVSHSGEMMIDHLAVFAADVMKVAREVGTEDDQRIEFCVMDTGIGIAKDKLNLIFDTICQADGSTTREYGGSGLGLSISKRFASLMQGNVWVESEVSKGSKFFTTTSQIRQSMDNHVTSNTLVEPLRGGLRCVDDDKWNRLK